MPQNFVASTKVAAVLVWRGRATLFRVTIYLLGPSIPMLSKLLQLWLKQQGCHVYGLLKISQHVRLTSELTTVETKVQ